MADQPAGPRKLVPETYIIDLELYYLVLCAHCLC